MKMKTPSTRPPTRRIPGETNGNSVFRIMFEDGCSYIGFTSGLIIDRVADICRDSRPEPPQGWLRHRREAIHASRMTKTVECLESGLNRRQARNLSTYLIQNPPAGFGVRNDTSGTNSSCKIWQEEQEKRMEIMQLHHDNRTGR